MRLIPLLVACFALSACALTVDKIDVPYQAAANLSVVNGADKVSVAVTGVEGRTVYKNRVSVKKNGYGMEMADIVATNDIPTTIGSAVEKELASLGFSTGPGGVNLQVEVTRFYSDFKTGFFTGDAVAEANANVKLSGPDGKLLYAKYYEAGGVEPDITLATGENARAALVKAMRNLVGAIINDADLLKAIMASKPSAITSASPAS